MSKHDKQDRQHNQPSQVNDAQVPQYEQFKQDKLAVLANSSNLPSDYLKEEFNSKLVPGAHFTVRKIGIGLKTRIEMQLSEQRYRLRELVRDHEAIEDKQSLAALRIDDEFALLNSQVQQAWVKAGLITASTVNPALTWDADTLIESGPIELFLEVADAIRSQVYLSAEERENLSLPTTSNAPEGGRTNNISAQIAS